MRNNIPLLAALALTGVLATGCANVEKKLGRGLSNTMEIVRLGEMRRTVEQTALWDGPDAAYTTGAIKGFNRSLARTGLGIYEVVTSPFPSYDPILTDYFAPSPVYPDNYKPAMVADSMTASDTYLGFSGGDVAPWIPGSRFRVFDTP